MKTLEITSYIGCPNNCHYCPQDLLKAIYKGNQKMTMDDFKLILNNTPKDVRIDFSGFSEIFVHPLGSQFIRHAVESGFVTIIYTTLVGFKESDANLLHGLSFDHVIFHQYDGVNLLEFERKRDIFCKEIQCGSTVHIANQPGSVGIISRAGTVFNITSVQGEYMCGVDGAYRNFNHNVVVPNGDVYVCCMDYGLKHRVGNLFTTNFDNLDRSEVVDASTKENSDTICRKCEKIRIFRK